MAGKDSSSEAAWRAETKENILENAPGHSSASTIALRFASRAVKRRLDRYVHPLLNKYRGKIDGYVPDKDHKDVQKEKWSNECIASLGKCLARRNGSSRNAGVLDFAKRRRRTKTSSRIPTEWTLTDPSSIESCSTGGSRRRSRTLLAPSGQRCRNKVTVPEVRMRAERGSNVFGRTTT